ncbi:hypothetical protein [Piscirickettsia litoralis]|uniref:CYTH domain-containing protein n=1 Tax=Piscirickettsia litoralis TaxID=1891921 RepID=A0ABX3A0Y2_9GAMM|nr:hypothetical protein [Piscirickettsia litoralis]ODN41060.1 hypothetical protein BGC07_18100 [Piscirickettsia litoralis]
MPKIQFQAWINRDKKNDPGHLVMFDHERKTTIELAPNRRVQIEGSLEAQDNRTGKKYIAKSWGLELKQNPQDKNIKEQLNKNRFTHIQIAEVEISEAQLENVRKRVALSFAGGRFNLFKEARVFDPLTGRCLLSLEVLNSELSSEPLSGANASEYLNSFIENNSAYVKNSYVQKLSNQESCLFYTKTIASTENDKTQMSSPSII